MRRISCPPMEILPSLHIIVMDQQFCQRAFPEPDSPTNAVFHTLANGKADMVRGQFPVPYLQNLHPEIPPCGPFPQILPFPAPMGPRL